LKRIKTYTEFITDHMNTNEEESTIIWKLVKGYISNASKWPVDGKSIREHAKDMIAEDILSFEKEEEYEVCARLKKAFEQIENLK